MKYYFITVCAGSLVLLLLMQTASGAMIAGNEYFPGMAASTNDINSSIMKKAPVAVFSCTPKSGPRPLTVTFTDSSKGRITSKVWEYKLNSVSTWTTFTLDRTSSFSFVNAGIYDVRLTVTGQGGSDSKTEPSFIIVNEATPVAAFSGTPTSGSQPLNVQFTDASTGIITSYTWNFGDGGSSNIQNPSHRYTAIGSYTVTLMVSGPGGSDYITKNYYITVGDAPLVAGFSGTPTSGPKPLNVQFTDASTGIITLYTWNFGDGGSSNIQNPSHQYSTDGTYTVNLIVTGPGGLSMKTEPNYISVANTMTKIGIYKDGVWSLDFPGGVISDTSLSWGISGDIPVTGDWNGDGKDDIGIFRPSSGIWSLDSNGNDIWDVSDTSVSWGISGDIPVNGDWNGDGKDGIGIFRPSSGIWSLDSNENFAWEGSDTSVSWGLPNDIPVVGDWNGDGKDGIGIFRPSSGIWSLDSNGNLAWEVSDSSLNWGLPNDVPVIGDWNGDKKSDIGIFRPSSGIWSLDSNGNLAWEVSDSSLSWGLPNDVPVIGNWNGDGTTKIGIFRPNCGIWSLDSNGDGVYHSSVNPVYTFLGEAGWTPIVGDWNGNGITKIGVYKDGVWYLDGNGNGEWNTATDKFYNNPARNDFKPVIGDWNGDGRSEIGVYRWGYWSLDSFGNGTYSNFPTFIADEIDFTPVVGDWNGNGKTKIGVYNIVNGAWRLDYDGNGVWNATVDKGYNFGLTPNWIQVVGDWNGDGKTKMGVFKDGSWRLDYNGNGSLIKVNSFGTPGAKPIIGDWNGDGKAKIGVYNTINGDWNLDYDGNGVWDATADKGYNIGVGIPVVGKWS